MKKIIFFIAIILMCASACSDLEDLNKDPNNPTETHPQLLLTQLEWTAFREFLGTSPLYANKMLVQTDGENSYQYYKWNRGDFSYTNMKDIQKMMEEAQKINENSYIALGKFLRAYYFYNMTLQFGDIPYSQALKGESDNVFAPVYDTQKDVLKGILTELEEAQTILEGETATIKGDIIYGGDTDKWQRLVNSFRLKVLLSLSLKESDSDLDIKNQFSAIFRNAPLMRDNQDNAQLVYLDQTDNRYPEFNSSSFGSGMYIDSTFIKRLQDHSDPRLFLFCTQTKEAKEAGKAIDDFTAYEGGDPAAPYGTVNEKATKGKVSKVLERFYQDPTNEPSILLGYAELQFILSEACVRGWISGDAATYYNNGVRSSFKFYETYAKGLSGYVGESIVDSYLANPINNLSTKLGNDLKIEAIVLQKYFQSYFQGGWTPFFENRRTGYPEYHRTKGVEIPYRWIYPQSEYSYNADNVSAAITRQFGNGNDKINQKTWWLQ